MALSMSPRRIPRLLDRLDSPLQNVKERTKICKVRSLLFYEPFTRGLMTFSSRPGSRGSRLLLLIPEPNDPRVLRVLAPGARLPSAWA
ncbi:hypothetical protein RRG08_035762 [Elysia crispata]|uniref:Uncharacterized protein n=1 Tax=Elysia crispata TaxID=231223 RepID=A0AAE1DID5_9GAST|nr:hypothetical protein RRG08_035762 [Elysia crispata]